MLLLSWLHSIVSSSRFSVAGQRIRQGRTAVASRKSSRGRRLEFAAVVEMPESRILLSSSPIPMASSEATPVRTVTAQPQWITVTYCDDVAIRAADIATGNIEVYGPNGYSQVATLVALTPAVDAPVITATYSVTAPGGLWDVVDTGAYAVYLLDAQVGDSVNPVPGGQIGSFIVEPNSIGPDSFGYLASQVPFEFQDISTTGTRILTNRNDATTQLTDAMLGDFQFPFYGTTYNALYVNTNGILTPISGFTDPNNNDLSSSSLAMIAGLWDDLVTTNTGIRWQLTGSGNDQSLIVQWDRADYVGATGKITFQIVIHETDGSIQFNYSDLNGTDVFQDEGLSATVGIKDTGTQGTRRLVVSQNSGPNAFVGSGKSIRIERDVQGKWMPLGPFSATNGQVENISPNNQIGGAIHTVIAHPTNSNILWVGATNGGIWRTDNAQSASPSWRPMTDHMPSMSTGALAFDVADSTGETVYAGIGRFSSYNRLGGARTGLLRTRDGGATWQVVDGGGTLVGKNISGLHVNGNTIVVSVNVADNFTFGNIGIFRSTDGGATFSQITQGDGTATGLPGGVSYDLVTNPMDSSALYTSTVFSDSVGGLNGVYKSTDEGATWSRVSSAAMNALFTNGTSNVELATGRSNEVYASIINGGVVVGLFRSGDGGATWTQMDTPTTNEGGTDVGLNPGGGKGPGAGAPFGDIAGGQGAIHFSIVADPTNANIVYVGGDRQPLEFQFPTSVGAVQYSGRLFRGDASKAAGSQWVHLTHSNTLGAAGGGTASSSSPHADSREMTFDAAGNLIETDDGGIYRRTSPRLNSGDWFGIIGDLQVTEGHDVAWDSSSHVAMSGNQDTGTTQQSTPGTSIWTSVSTADGGDVAIDDRNPGSSIRYSSFQNLGGLLRATYDASGNLTASASPALTVVSGSALSRAFRTPISVNQTNGALIIQGTNGVYESLNGGSTISQINSSGGSGVANNGLDQNAIVAGGSLGGLANPDILWVGSAANVFLRSVAGGTLTTVNAPTTDSTILDLAADSANWMKAFVIDRNEVSMTSDAGTSWTDITGDLLSFTSDFRTLSFVSTALFDAIVVGTGSGVYFSPLTSFGTIGSWVNLGANLPNAIVYDMEYDSTDDVLVAGTMGRGSWILNDAAEMLMTTLLDFDYGDAPASFGIRASQDGGRHVATGVTLGSRRDFEADGMPTPDASGDDSNNLTDDEDGVTFLEPFVSGTSAQISVNVSAQTYISVLMDLDLNGVWDDAGGEVISAQLIPAGDTLLTLPVMSGITVPTTTWIRVLVTTDSGSGNYSGGAPDGEVEDYEVTILPQTQLDITLDSSSMSENGGAITGTVTRIGAGLSGDMIVQLSSSDISEATVPLTVTIPDGQASATFPVTSVDDTLLDGSQALSLDAVFPGTISGTMSLTVTDYESLSFSLSATQMIENAGVNALTGTVTRNNTDVAAPLLVTLTSSDSTEATIVATVLIPGGSSSAPVSINAVDDFLLDGTINVTISAIESRYVTGSVAIDVRDNEGALLVVAENGGNTIVNESGASDSFSVVLSEQPDSDVVLTITGLNAAEATADFAILTFTPITWNTAQIVTITGVDDPFVDGNKTMNGIISVNDAASDILYRGAPDQTVSIVNQDNEVVGLIVSESGGTTLVSEAAGIDTVTFRLIDRPLSNVAFSVQVSDSTEASALPTTLTFTTANWNTPQVVTITGVDDDFVDGNISSLLRISVIPAQSDNAFDSMPDTTVNIVTTDTEVAGFLILETAGGTVVNESGTTDTLSVRLSAKPESNVVFNISASDTGEATAGPAVLTFTPVNWNVSQLVTITGVNDLLFDGSQTSQLTVAVNAANSQDAFDALLPSLIVVTTTDDEPSPPTVIGPPADTRTHFPIFVWTPVAGAISYDVWVTNLKAPNSPVIYTTVTGTSLTSPIPLEIAQHRVWVKANLSTGISTPWSAFRKFDVRTPPAVQPLVRLQDTYRPTITWSPVYKAATYQVQIDSRFTAPTGLIFASGVTSTSFVVPQDLPLGLYRVWIRALATNGNFSAWSDPGEFQIAVFPTAPNAFSSTFDTTPTLRWTPVLGARAYRVRIFNTTTSQYVVDQTGIQGVEFTSPVVLSPGQHRWNVQALGENEVVGLWSFANSLYIGGRSQILAPIGPQTLNRPMFRWQAVEGAFTYTLHIVRTNGNAPVTLVNNLITNTWTPPTPMAAGSYRVWVQAVSSSGQMSPWSVPVDFTIVSNSIDPFSMPLTDSPVNSVLHHNILARTASMPRRASSARDDEFNLQPQHRNGQTEFVSLLRLDETETQSGMEGSVVVPLTEKSIRGPLLPEPMQSRSTSIPELDAVLAHWDQLNWWQ